MNILIDDLPTDYQGYLFNYSFRSGILISECLSDESISQPSRILASLYILFGKGVPPFELAMQGLRWFLNCGELPENSTVKEEKVFSFVEDRNMIFSAFMVKYGINLNQSNLHWFEFISLFNDLEKTAFRRVVDLRSLKTKDLKNFSKDQRIEIIKLKNKFSLEKNNSLTSEQLKAIEHFNKLIGEN